jgi:predicted alpha/beta superfamily hydrolase
MNISRPLESIVAVVFLTSSLGAQSKPSKDDQVPAHDSFTVASTFLKESRLINVHLPSDYRAASVQHFPVLYMLDGGIDEDFPRVVNTIDSLTTLGVIRPVIVVGIPNTQRRRDLTGPTRAAKDSAIAPLVGGSGPFRRFIRDELMPAIRARYRNTDERGIVGESLAGLFVVETFLIEPTLFNHYVALDPSLWWNSGALVSAAPAYLRAFDNGKKTLYLTTSNVEDITTPTSQFAALLRGVPPYKLTWVYEPRPDLTHATIFRGAGPAALASALK